MKAYDANAVYEKKRSVKDSQNGGGTDSGDLCWRNSVLRSQNDNSGLLHNSAAAALSTSQDDINRNIIQNQNQNQNLVRPADRLLTPTLNGNLRPLPADKPTGGGHRHHTDNESTSSECEFLRQSKRRRNTSKSNCCSSSCSSLFTMLDILSKVRIFLPRGSTGIVLDDQWDQANRSFMFILLLLFSLNITLRQYTGNVISCVGFSKFNKDFVEDYCWTQGLYTIKEAYDKPDEYVPYPGIIPEDMPPCIERKLKGNRGWIFCPEVKENEHPPPVRIYHLWYQWVPFYFGVTAIAFYLPYMLYKSFGMQDIKPLLNLLHNPIATEEEMRRTISKATTWLYFKFSMYMNMVGQPQNLPTRINTFLEKHRLGITTVLVKAMYLCISGGIFYLTTRMFQIGDYLTYGSDWAQSMMEMTPSNITTTEIKDKLFPKMIACEVKRWGTTGIETERGMCVLAPNVINQYLFLILWFALVTVVIIDLFSVLLTVGRMAYLSGSYRTLLLTTFIKDDVAIRQMYYNVGSSGRIILHVLAANVTPKIFEDIAKELSAKVVKVEGATMV